MSADSGSHDERPGVPLPSGFENGRRRSGLSKEAQARVRAKAESVDAARRLAMESAHSFVIGGCADRPPQSTQTEVQ